MLWELVGEVIWPLMAEVGGYVVYYTFGGISELFYPHLNDQAKRYRNGAFISVAFTVVMVILGVASVLPALASIILSVAGMLCFFVYTGLCFSYSDRQRPEPRWRRRRQEGELK
jgi:hypothetical protein